MDSEASVAEVSGELLLFVEFLEEEYWRSDLGRVMGCCCCC